MLNPIQSARLRSSRGFNFRYGKVEVEARLPVGDWLWPGTSSRLCFVFGFGLVRHHFCALWLAVAWYVITFVLCCGLVRHHVCALWLAVAWYVITFVLCDWVWCGTSRVTVVLCGCLWPGTSVIVVLCDWLWPGTPVTVVRY